AKPPAERDDVVVDVAAVEADDAGRRLDQPRAHLRGGRLAGTIRPQIADDFSTADGKAHIVDDGNPEEPFGQMACLEHLPPFAEGVGYGWMTCAGIGKSPTAVHRPSCWTSSLTVTSAPPTDGTGPCAATPR